MDKRQQSKIFKLFTNIDSENQDTTKSIGIALNVSQQIVRAMGGELGFKSSKGLGT
jgi:signal transduction histidine kinase